MSAIPEGTLEFSAKRSPTVCRRKLHDWTINSSVCNRAQHQALGSDGAKWQNAKEGPTKLGYSQPNADGRSHHSQPMCAEGGICLALFGEATRLTTRSRTRSDDAGHRFRRTSCESATSPERTATECSTLVSTSQRANNDRACMCRERFRRRNGCGDTLSALVVRQGDSGVVVSLLVVRSNAKLAPW
jgi:hypothetical protein